MVVCVSWLFVLIFGVVVSVFLFSFIVLTPNRSHASRTHSDTGGCRLWRLHGIKEAKANALDIKRTSQIWVRRRQRNGIYIYIYIYNWLFIFLLLFVSIVFLCCFYMCFVLSCWFSTFLKSPGRTTPPAVVCYNALKGSNQFSTTTIEIQSQSRMRLRNARG